MSRFLTSSVSRALNGFKSLSYISRRSIVNKPHMSLRVFHNPWDRLRKIEDGKFRTNGPHNEHQTSHMIYGGSLVCTAVYAAYDTVPADYHFCNLHSYYLLTVWKGQQAALNILMTSADGHEPLDFEVKKTRDGKTFIFREVFITQKGKPIFQCQLTFRKLPTKNFFTHIRMPDVPPPEQFLTAPEYLDTLDLDKMDKRVAANAAMRTAVPILEMRPANKVDYLLGPETPTMKQCLWIKWNCQPVSNDPKFASLVLSGISDAGTSMCGASFWHAEPLRIMISQDHVVWVHDVDFDVSEFVLFEQDVEWHSDGTSLVTGRIWRRDGRLLASIGQQVFVEPVNDSKI